MPWHVDGGNVRLIIPECKKKSLPAISMVIFDLPIFYIARKQRGLIENGLIFVCLTEYSE
jgi:hypothetical protein